MTVRRTDNSPCLTVRVRECNEDGAWVDTPRPPEAPVAGDRAAQGRWDGCA